MSLVKGWIRADESAKEMLSRVLAERPSLVLPPLHRVPLRVGNVVEVVGPSHSAKTEILIQVLLNLVILAFLKTFSNSLSANEWGC